MVSCRDYENYYKIQAGGGGISYFSGPQYQRGYGLGNIFSGLLRRIIPIFTSTAGEKLSNAALKTGVKVAGDII